MRRTILGVFFLLAACGGGARSPNTDAVNRSADTRAARQQFLFSADARAAIAAYAKVFNPDAVDTCLAAWLDEAATPVGLHEPIAKPDVAGLRRFLNECLGASGPVDARAPSPVDALRTSGSGAMRSVTIW